jgi:hypothetical protein
VVTDTAFLRLGLAVLWLWIARSATFLLRLAVLWLWIARSAWLGWFARRAWLGWRWHRPHLGDDDLLHDLPGHAPDLLAELLSVKFPAHHHHLLLLLVLKLHLLDAELLCIK